MKKLLLSILLFVATVSANAQSATFQWAKNMDGYPSSDAYGQSVAVDTAGNVYTTGYFSGTIDFDPGTGIFNLTAAGGFDIFISKLDSTGNFVWAKNMGSSLGDVGNSITLDAAGNVYTTGHYYGPVDFDPGPGVFNIAYDSINDSPQIFISKLDSYGNFVWAKNMSSTSDADANFIAVDGAGNIYTTGYFNGTADFDPGAGTFNLTATPNHPDIFISKLDPSGNFIWAKNIGGTLDDIAYSVAVDKRGNVYTTGYFQDSVDFDPGTGTYTLGTTSYYYSDMFISKLDSAGNFVWAKEMKGTMKEYGYSITTDTAGNVYTTGTFTGTVDFDPGIGTFNLTTAGTGDIFISKLDPNGNFVWAKNMGGTLNNRGYSITLDTAGNVYTTGAFQGTVDFDPGAGTFNLTSSDGYHDDIFISKLDPLGNFIWVKNIRCYGVGKSIAINASENIFSTGYFAGYADFGSIELSGHSEHDAFACKISQGPSLAGISESTIADIVSIYPNPTNSFFNIVISTPEKNVRVEIYNSEGALIYNKQITTGTNTIELTNQANGLYFVKVMSENKIVTTQKIIKE